jgi:hypothetical protein
MDAVTVGEKISHLSIKAKKSLMEVFLWYIPQDQVRSFVSSWILGLYKKERLEHSQLATEVLLLFGTTYLCGKKFQ